MFASGKRITVWQAREGGMAGVLSDDEFMRVYGDKQPGIIILLFARGLSH